MPFYVLLALVFMISSCGTSSEELWIEDDGSGRLEMGSDLSGLYPLIMMGLESEVQKSKDGDGSEAKKADNPLLTLLKRDKVDTIVNFQEFLMAAAGDKLGNNEEEFWDGLEQEMLADESMPIEQKEAIFNMVKTIFAWDFKLQANQEEQLFNTGMIQPFDHIANVHDWADDMMEFASEMAKEDESMDMGKLNALKDMMNGDGMTRYEINGNKLRVTRRAANTAGLAGDDEAAQAMAMMQMFAGEEPYRITIHVPGKIRNISDPNVVKLDNNTVMLEISQEDLKDPEKEVDFTIEFRLPKGMR